MQPSGGREKKIGMRHESGLYGKPFRPCELHSLQKARDTVHRAQTRLKDRHAHAGQSTERDAACHARDVCIRSEQLGPQIRIPLERRRIGGNVLRHAVPPRRTQWRVRSEGAAIVVRLPRRVLQLPLRVARRCPGVGVGDVGVVGD
jgi:hypothetical protein